MSAHQSNADKVRKFLEFNGTDIEYTYQEGKWWVAIKPICEALGVNFENQRKNIHNDKSLSLLPSNQTVVAADNKLRKMLCLPERYVYGWIFTIQSNSEELAEYKLKCHDILFSYFRGTITKREKVLLDKSTTQVRIEELTKKLMDNEYYKELEELKKNRTACNNQLKKLDKELLSNQMDMDFEQEKTIPPKPSTKIKLNTEY